MARGKPEIDRERCNGCARCIPVCPQAILTMAGRKKPRRKGYAYCVDEEICTACGDCAMACPTGAIRVWSYTIVAGG